MAHLNRGRPTALALGAIFLLILTGICFVRQDVFSWPTEHLNDNFLSITANRTISSSRNSTSAAIAGFDYSGLVKKAVPYGHEAAPECDFFEYFNRTQHAIPKRAVTITLEQAVKNGLQYWSDLTSGGHQSHWDIEDMTGTEEFGNNQVASLGWSRNEGGSRHIAADLREAFNELNIPGLDDFNIATTLLQDLTFQRCGALQSPTMGINDSVYNVAGKTIVATFNYSPQFRLRQRLKVSTLSAQQATLGLPQVTRWSDIVWIVWSDSGTLDPSKASALKYIFRHDVVTDNTVYIIEQILGLGRKEFPEGGEWPGFEFRPGQNKFWALLGTDHGRGVANLIRDHQSAFELKGKSIESIKVFRQAPLAEVWHILFTLTGPGNEPLDPSQMVPPDSPFDSDLDDDSSSNSNPPKNRFIS